MATSGTYGFNLPNADVIIEAFDRCEIRGTALTRNHVLSARRSLNLALLTWSNRGVNLWEEIPFTIRLIAGQATYVTGNGVSNISPNIVSITEVYYTLINGGGSGVNTDRIMLPISRTDYDQLPNKEQQGTPTTYWYEKLLPGQQQITFWEVPNVGYPTAQIGGHYLSRMQDAAPVSGQTPDVPYLFLDALCAEMAARLSTKFAPDKLDMLTKQASDAWILASETDREDVPFTILPANGWMQGRF